MTDRPRPSTTAICAATALAVGGMLAHNVLEFGPVFLLDPQTFIPFGIFVILAVLAARRSAGAGTWFALLVWAVINLTLGGIISVLPLGLLPFHPEQSLGHYGAHVIYALAETPLVLVAWSGFSASRARHAPADDVR